MLIGIDSRELCGRPTGVGRYLANLLAAWDRLSDAAPHRFVLYAPDALGGRSETKDGTPQGAAAGLAAPYSNLDVRVRPLAGGSGTVWEQVHLAAAVRRERPDVLFAPAYTAPLMAGVPVALTVHDLSFLAHPEWFPTRMRWRQRVLTTLAARRAARVLTDSEFSRQEILARLGLPEEKVTVVPLGVTPPPCHPASAPPPSAAPDRVGEPVVLFVGSIFNRRHVPELIRAVARVAGRHPHVRLEVVGDNRTFPRQDLDAVARSAGVADRTTIRSYVSDEALADLYGRARVFVFLSDYEGFGLTPLEALSCGIPILVGDTPVAREVYGSAAAYVPTRDESRVAEGIERLLFDAAAREAVLERAPGVLERYSWERAARQTLAALVTCTGERVP